MRIIKLAGKNSCENQHNTSCTKHHQRAPPPRHRHRPTPQFQWYICWNVCKTRFPLTADLIFVSAWQSRHWGGGWFHLHDECIMKWEACDLKFPAATSNMRQCWVMLSDRERAKLPRRQLAKRSIAQLETKLNMCKCSKRVASRLLRQAGESRKCHDWRG